MIIICLLVCRMMSIFVSISYHDMRVIVKALITLALAAITIDRAIAEDHPGLVSPVLSQDRFTLVEDSKPVRLIVSSADDTAVLRAARDLQEDFFKVTGTRPSLGECEGKGRAVIIGSPDSPYIRKLTEEGKLDGRILSGCYEKYVITTVEEPLEGVDEALVIAGSDRRGTVYGIYELSEQIGVSPWYDWADVPVLRQTDLSIARGTYTAGEPAVRYRGIFLNDEAPCLTGWVEHTYGTGYGDHRFYERVFELILRLRGNFIWPAMWSWAFYADDPMNSRTADEMGIIVGTSHHEPMARNHQEWARNRKDYGEWNYRTNRKVIERFFREGIERMEGTDDIVTIGMRGDGDEAMSAEADVALLERIIADQRRIIRQVTGRPADQTPQVWALYKEVQDSYGNGKEELEKFIE